MWACQNGYKKLSALLLEHGELPLRIYIAEVSGMFCSLRITCVHKVEMDVEVHALCAN